MDNRESFRKTLLCARIEYVRWLHGPRMIIVAVILVFVHRIVVRPMIEAAAQVGAINIFEPFIAVCNAQKVMLLFPVLFMVLISDFPYYADGRMFFVFRLGRRSWLNGQFILLLMTALTVLCCMFIMCVGCAVLQGAEWSLSWSDAVCQASLTALIPANLYSQMPIDTAVMLCCGFMLLQCVLIGTFLIVMSLYGGKRIGMAIIASSIGLGLLLIQIDSPAQWMFPIAHTILKAHYTAHFSKPIFPIELSLCYFLALVGTFVFLAHMRVRKFMFLSEA